jgi:hypothetical protein
VDVTWRQIGSEKLEPPNIAPAVFAGSTKVAQAIYGKAMSAAPRRTGNLKALLYSMGKRPRLTWYYHSWGIDVTVNLRPFSPMLSYWHLVELGTTSAGEITPRTAKALKTPYGAFARVQHRGSKAQPHVGPAIQQSEALGARILMRELEKVKP